MDIYPCTHIPMCDIYICGVCMYLPVHICGADMHGKYVCVLSHIVYVCGVCMCVSHVCG